MTEVVLRDYRRGDAAAMYALDVECFQPPFRFSRRAMRGFAEAAGAIVVLAEAEAALAGFSIVSMEVQAGQKIGYVVTLDVAEVWRRRGLAGRLMTEMESRVRVVGAERMSLHVSTSNSGAIQFYQAAGYVRVGEVKGFYGQGAGGLGWDAWIYAKGLAL